MVIEKSTFTFLKDLKKHNQREWFQHHKQQYLDAQENVAGWLDTLIDKMNRHDQLQTRHGKEALYRIYNDVRFSTDKTPYNPRFAGRLKRVQPYLRGGYYFWLKPGESKVGCGFTYPNASDLLRIRQDISSNSEDWRQLLKNRTIRKHFGNMQGDCLTTAPKGFPKDHPAVDLLRYKQYWFEKHFSDQEVLAADFVRRVDATFQGIRPFFDYMTEILTTDLNGESILIPI